MATIKDVQAKRILLGRAMKMLSIAKAKNPSGVQKAKDDLAKQMKEYSLLVSKVKSRSPSTVEEQYFSNPSVQTQEKRDHVKSVLVSGAN